MKATFELEPDLYAAAERLAQAQAKTLGQVVSELLRRALGPNREQEAASVAELEGRNGFDVFPERAGEKVTVATGEDGLPVIRVAKGVITSRLVAEIESQTP